MCQRLICILLATFFVCGCKQKSVKGVIIGSTLYEGQTAADNRKLCDIIDRALNKERTALLELIGFNCGGAAGCYDLGYVVTQIVNRIGEKEIIQLTKDFTKPQRNELLGLIEVGLEYGDNNYDGKMDEARIEATYPILEKALDI